MIIRPHFIEDSHFTPSASNYPAASGNIHPTSNNTDHRFVDTDARQLTNHLRTSDVNNNKTINGNQIVDSHTSINDAVIPPYGVHIAINDEIPGAVTSITAVTVDGSSVTSVTSVSSDGYHPSTSGVSMSDNESSVVLVHR